MTAWVSLQLLGALGHQALEDLVLVLHEVPRQLELEMVASRAP